MTATTTALPVRADGLHAMLPQDGAAGTLVGRVWRTGTPGGPAVVALRPEGVFDVSRSFATMSTLLETDEPARAVRSAAGEFVCTLEALLDNSKAEDRDAALPWLLAPCDLQV
ncbi:MAG: fumarylacetoacetate hydrolase, partial [Rubrivivax sp.]